MNSRATHPERDLPRDASPADARRFASSIIRAVEPEVAFRAQSVIESSPRLRRYKTAVIDLLVEEYIRRRRAGESIDRTRFAAQIPEYRSAVLLNLDVYDALATSNFDNDRLSRIDVGHDFLGLTLEELLGVGSFSKVFRASESALGGRCVVAKVCQGGGLEASMLGRLDHPGIVPVHSVKEDPDSDLSVITMPYLGRATLADVIDRCFPTEAADPSATCLDRAIALANAEPETPQRTPQRGTFLDRMLQILADVAEALAFAHQAGVCHLDVKPSNILITAEARVFLLDFNLAREFRFDRSSVGGTLPFMAPEQLEAIRTDNDIPASPAVDVYAFGVMAWQSLTGQLPLGDPPSNGSRAAIAKQLLDRLKTDRLSPSTSQPRLPTGIQRILRKCLSPDVADRPASATELLQLLRREQHVIRRLLRKVDRNRRATLLTAATSIALLAGGLEYQAGRPPRYLREFSAGVAAVEAEEYDRAWQHFDAAQHALPEDLLETSRQSEVLFARGRAAMGRQDFESSLADFTAALDLAPDNGRYLACSGYTIAKLAIENDAGRLEPSFQRRISEGRHLMRQARDAGLSSVQLDFDIAYCTYLLRQEEQAQRQLAEVVEADPDHAGAHRLLAELELGRAVLAREPADDFHMLRALESEASDPELHFRAACLYANRMRWTADETLAGQERRKCLDHWTAAVELAFPVERVTQLYSFAQSLQHDPEFNAVRSEPSVTTPKRVDCLLVDPLGDAQSGLFDATMFVAAGG